MQLNQFKEAIQNLENLEIILEDGTAIPSHFHITEVGQIDKKFIDCGGTIRFEKKVSFQLWSSVDVWHRLSAEKLLKIIELSQEKLGIEDGEIEVEYQSDTIGKYGLTIKDNKIVLTSLQTDCLASDKCGIPVDKIKKNLSELSEKATSCCTPGSGCC